MKSGLTYLGDGVAAFECSATGSSSASLETIEACFQRALYQIVLGRVPAESSKAATSFGTLVHKSMEERSKWLISNRKTDFLSSVKPTLFTEAAKPENKIPVEDHRTLDLLFHVLQEYHARYPDETFDTAYFRNKDGELQPAIEMPFACQLTEDNGDHASFTLPTGTMLRYWEAGEWIERETRDVRIIYRGKIDLIFLNSRNNLYFRDYKTASMDTPMYFPMMFHSEQMSGYHWLVSRIQHLLLDKAGNPLNKPIAGVELDRLLFGKPTQSPTLTLLKRREKSLQTLLAKFEKPDYAPTEKAREKDEKKVKSLKKEVAKLQDQVLTAAPGMPEVKLDRVQFHEFSQETSLHWRRNIIATIRDFLLAHSSGFYKLNRSACQTKFGICPYFADICSQPASRQYNLLMSPLFEDRQQPIE